jgi:hypothetical protein
MRQIFKLASLANENKKIELDLLSQRLDAEKDVRDAYAKGDETAAKGKIAMYSKFGLIDPSVNYKNLVVTDSEDNMIIGGIKVDPLKAAKKLDDINIEIAQDYSKINSDIVSKLNILQGQGDIDVETYMTSIGSPSSAGDLGSSVNPTSIGAIGQLNRTVDTGAAIEYFRATGQFTDLVDRYDELKLKQNKLVDLETGITKQVYDKTSSWMNTLETSGGVINTGDKLITYENGQYFVTDYRGDVSSETYVPGQSYSKTAIPKSQVPSIVANEAKKMKHSTDFVDNNGSSSESIQISTIQTLAANKLESEWFENLSSTGILPIIGGDVGAFVGSKDVASSLSSYIANNRGNYSDMSDDDFEIITLMQNPKSLDKLIENELAAKTEGGVFSNAIGKNISVNIDRNKGTASIVIGDKPYPVPINQIPNSPAAQIYLDMDNEFKRKTKLAAKENQLISGWDFSSEPNRTKPAETLPLTVGNETILTDFNITTTYDDVAKTYSFYPSISFRGKQSNPININTKTLGDIYGMPLEDLLFTNYADAYDFMRKYVMNEQVLVGAYNKYRTK